MLRSNTSSCMRVACIRCSRLSGRRGASRKATNRDILSFCQRHRNVVWIGETAQAPIRQPATAKLAAPLSGIPTGSRQARLAASQYRTDTREQFAQPEWLGKVVVRTQFEANDAIDFVAAMTCRYDDRHIRARPDRTQQIQSIVLAELQIKDNQTLLVGEMSHGAVAIGGRDDAHAVLGEIVLGLLDEWRNRPR